MLLYKKTTPILRLGINRGIFVYILSVLIAAYDNQINGIFETQKSTLVHGFTH